MKKIIIYIFLIVFSFKSYSQDPNMVFSKHNLMLGGDRKISTARTLVMDLEIETPKGKVPAKIKVIESIGYKIEITPKDGKKSYELVSSSGYYKMDQSTNSKEVKQTTSPEYKLRSFLMKIYPMGNHNSPDFMSQMEIMGMVEEDGKPCFAYKKMIEGPELSLIYYIDQVSFQIVKVKGNYTTETGEQKEIVFTYGNFLKAKDGSFYPGEISTPYGKAIVKSYKVNEAVAPNEFNVEFK